MRRALLLLAMLLAINTSYGWGKRGHDVICYIAECHLSEAAKTTVDELLDGYSMVYYSSWMDNASHTKEFAKTKGWHYFNMERNESVATAKRAKGGDVLSASEELIAQLRDPNTPRDKQSIALKMLIHLIGDMHQPMHLGREEDEGGNNIPIVYFVESTSLHGAWDYHVVMGAHEWSYTEWQQQLDRLKDEQEAAIVSGEMSEWIDATHSITREIYRDTRAETRIFYDYMNKYTPIVEQQLLYAGLRLAHILNNIYTEK